MQVTARAAGAGGVVLLWVAFMLPVRVYDDAQRPEGVFLLHSLDSAEPWAYLAAVVAATALVVLGLRREPGAVRAVALAAVAALAAYLVTRLGADFIVTWSADDALGRPVGGLTRTELAVGAWSGIAGGALLVVSAVGSLLVPSAPADPTQE